MPLAELDGDHISVQTSYTDRDRMLLVPGSSYKNDGTWNVPLSWASCVILRGVFKHELRLGSQLTAWGNRTRTRVQRAMELRTLTELPADSPGAAVLDKVEASSDLKLRAFQRVDVAFFVTMETAGLYMPMGAGKTAVAIRTLQVLSALGLNPFPALIIAPKSVTATVWPGELAKWAPELSVSVVDGSASVRRKQIAAGADVTVINWEAAQLHSRVAGYGDIRLTDKDKQAKELNELGLRTVIMDEAHRLRAPTTKQSRTVKYLAHHARFRFELTGTPVSDDGFDLWGLLHVIAPTWHPGKTRYGDRYILSGFNIYGGMTVLGLKPDTQEEFRKVTEPLYRRLPKEIILPQLPPKLPVQTRYTHMTPKQAKLYKQMEDEQIAQLDDLLTAPRPVEVLMRLLQFAAASASVVEKITDDEGKVHQKVILEAPSSKIDDLVELVEELAGEPLVAGAVSRQLLDLAGERLTKEGITWSMIAGGMTTADRARAVADFQAGKTQVILVVLRAGAEGLTLTRSRVLLFMQEDWDPGVNDQFEDRVHRIGSEIHSSVQIIKQVTPGTVEERKELVLTGKRTRTEEVLRDRDIVSRLLGVT